MTTQQSFNHGSGSQHPIAAPPAQAVEEPVGSSAVVARSQPPPASLLKDVERRIEGTFKQAISPVTTSLTAMDKRLSQIESRQQILKQALKDGREDIMEMINDVEWDLMVELKK